MTAFSSPEPPFALPRHTACASRPVDGDWLAAVASLEDEPYFWWLEAPPVPGNGRFLRDRSRVRARLARELS